MLILQNDLPPLKFNESQLLIFENHNDQHYHLDLIDFFFLLFMKYIGLYYQYQSLTLMVISTNPKSSNQIYNHRTLNMVLIVASIYDFYSLTIQNFCVIPLNTINLNSSIIHLSFPIENPPIYFNQFIFTLPLSNI